MEDRAKAAPQFVPQDEFFIAGTVTTTFFGLSLFTRVSEHGLLYAPPVNFRSALCTVLKDKGKSGMSLEDHAFSNKMQHVFQSNGLQVLFYKEKEFSELSEPVQKLLEPCKLLTMAREKIKVETQIIEEVLLKFEKVPLFPTQEQLLQVAYILNVPITPAGSHSDKNYPQFLDFASILFHLKHFSPDNTEQLTQFIKNTLKWIFFELTECRTTKGDHPGIEEAKFYENMWRLRSFFQALHPIGVAYVEGNH